MMLSALKPLKGYIFLLLFLLLAMFTPARAQTFRDYRWGLTTGYAYAGEHFLQLGALYGRDYGNMHLPPIGFGAGSDVGFARDGVTFGPKAFVEYQAFIFAGTRLNIINYIRDGQHDLRILPEAGITLFGYLNLMYGYGLPVVGSELDAVSRHRFSLTINLIRP